MNVLVIYEKVILLLNMIFSETFFLNIIEGSSNIDNLFNDAPIISMVTATTIQKSYSNLKIAYRRRIDSLTERMTEHKFIYPPKYIQ